MNNFKHNVLFVGLGKIGRRVSFRISGPTFRVWGYDIAIGGITDDEKGYLERLSIVKDISEFPSAEIILLSLPHNCDQEELISSCLLHQRSHDKGYVINTSTLSPERSVACSEITKERGWNYIECPLTGGLIGAEVGTMTAIVGCPFEIPELCELLFQRFCKVIIRFDKYGDASAIKHIHNMVGEIEVQAFGQALELASALGLPMDSAAEVLGNGMATSDVFRYLYLPQLRSGQGAINATVNAALHEQLNVLDLAKQVGFELHFTPTVLRNLKELQKRGLGTQDVSSVRSLFGRDAVPF